MIKLKIELVFDLNKLPRRTKRNIFSLGSREETYSWLKNEWFVMKVVKVCQEKLPLVFPNFVGHILYIFTF